MVIPVPVLARAHRRDGSPKAPKAVARSVVAAMRWIAIGLVLSSLADTAVAQSPAERRGERFVRLNCARCHAIDKVGESPLPSAPPFRTLHLKYPVSDLQRPLAQGVHPVMPRFELEASQVADIMSYLKTLER
jgi:cytochrome c